MDLRKALATSQPRATQRHRLLRDALAVILADLSGELGEAESNETARILRAIQLTAASGQNTLAALEGVAPPRHKRGESNSDIEDVEPAYNGPGYSGPLGIFGQGAENHGQRIVQEGLAIARAYLDSKRRPKCQELMNAFYMARDQKDDAVMKQLSERIETEFGLKMVMFDPDGTDTAESPSPADQPFEEAGEFGLGADAVGAP